MASYNTSLPLYITTGVANKKHHYLNINKVFNMHFQLRNSVKKLFAEIVGALILSCPVFHKPIQITYVIYKPTKRRYDVMNVVAIIDKFFQDTLVEHGKITDDSYLIVPKVIGVHGGVDKYNPRVDVIIEEIKR